MYKLRLFRNKDKITYSIIRIGTDEILRCEIIGDKCFGYCNKHNKEIGYNLDIPKKYYILIPGIIIHEISHAILSRSKHHNLLHKAELSNILFKLLIKKYNVLYGEVDE